MAFKADFTLDGKTYRVFECSYSFGQSVDDTGQPSGEVKGGTITLKVESTGSTAIAAWMIDPYMKKDGSIVFYKKDSKATQKEVKFKEGYCTDYKEIFDHMNEKAMGTTFTISAKEITIGDVVHTNDWPED